jgi:hypothetical protein
MADKHKDHHQEPVPVTAAEAMAACNSAAKSRIEQMILHNPAIEAYVEERIAEALENAAAGKKETGRKR